MIQFRLSKKVQELFGFQPDNLSAPIDTDALLGNWYADILHLDGNDSLVFMSEKTYLSFVLLAVRPDHADVMPNGFVNGLEHLLEEEKFAERSIDRMFVSIDMMEITATDDTRLIKQLSEIQVLYKQLVDAAGGLNNCDILEIMKKANRTPWPTLKDLAPINVTKKLLRNSDENLH